MPEIGMGNSRDLALDAATPSMILRYHHDYPFSLYMCIFESAHQEVTGRYTALGSFLRQVYAGSGTSGCGQGGSSRPNHQAELL